MNWEKITSPEFERAVEECGRTCLLPIGVVEKHGDHLPLGQDSLSVHKVATMAAEEEPAMVFPPYYFGQILEAKHVPGTIALQGELLIPLLENICDEIGRNGFTKIIIVDGHGGNRHLLPYFGQLTLDKRKEYMVYISGLQQPTPAEKEISEAAVDEHAGERETSSMLHLYPELVKLEAYEDYGMPHGRMKAFAEAGLFAGIYWYADHPGHLAAEKVPFTAEKGKVYVQARVGRIVKQIRLVKSDETPIQLYREFHKRATRPSNGPLTD